MGDKAGERYTRGGGARQWIKLYEGIVEIGGTNTPWVSIDGLELEGVLLHCVDFGASTGVVIDLMHIHFEEDGLDLAPRLEHVGANGTFLDTTTAIVSGGPEELYFPFGRANANSAAERYIIPGEMRVRMTSATGTANDVRVYAFCRDPFRGR